MPPLRTNALVTAISLRRAACLSPADGNPFYFFACSLAGAAAFAPAACLAAGPCAFSGAAAAPGAAPPTAAASAGFSAFSFLILILTVLILGRPKTLSPSFHLPFSNIILSRSVRFKTERCFLSLSEIDSDGWMDMNHSLLRIWQSLYRFFSSESMASALVLLGRL